MLRTPLRYLMCAFMVHVKIFKFTEQFKIYPVLSFVLKMGLSMMITKFLNDEVSIFRST